eukprot:gene8030-16459_t
MLDTTDMHSEVVSQAVRAVQYNHFDILMDLISKKAVSASATDSEGCSLLHWASINNRLDIVYFLLSQGCDVNYCGGFLKETPVHWAVRKKHYALVDLLAKNGADLSIVSSGGIDALHLACQKENVDMAFVLLCNGANVNSLDKDGNTPLHWILKEKPWVADVIRLLLRFGADVHLQEHVEGNTPMHLCMDLDLPTLNLLYESGGETVAKIRNKRGLTPYKLAAKLRNSHAIRFFYDMWLYRHGPPLLTVLASASALGLFFLLVALHGKIYGPLYWVASLFLLEKLFLPTINDCNSDIEHGFAWGAVFTIAITYYLQLRPLLSHAMSQLFGVGFLATVVSLFMCARTKPHGLRKNSDRQSTLAALLASSVQSNDGGAGGGMGMGVGVDSFRLCSTCLVDKSQATMHCARCNMCVLDLDHHCPFVLNCVGRGNRRIFTLFTGTAGLSCGLFAVLSYWLQFVHFCPTQTGMLGGFFAKQMCMFDQRPALFGVTSLASFLSLWIFGMFLIQLLFVANDTTQLEVMRNRHDGRLRGGIMRYLNNIGYFCWTGKFTVVSRNVRCKSSGGGSGVGFGTSSMNNVGASLISFTDDVVSKEDVEGSGGGGGGGGGESVVLGVGKPGHGGVMSMDEQRYKGYSQQQQQQQQQQHHHGHGHGHSHGCECDGDKKDRGSEYRSPTSLAINAVERRPCEATGSVNSIVQQMRYLPSVLFALEMSSISY